ncbi:uncharacterized protein YdbL (DUF1318 family) [Variibacter gotjawalensis]|uniref:hypothetical protein n=1 Tax=Variibacter gotjawalensis TaxID=1333996 RepID=UPI0013EE48F8|nr:hypothetical protein [Variibacter gotjawalensis]NIK49406.1 uncharacterized protein YdbL (DUF1318 family) [Variibacter gotjawalensis]
MGLSAGLYAVATASENFPQFESATDVHNLLEKKSRLLGAEIRMLEQRRQALRAMEKARDAVYGELAASVAMLTSSANALTASLNDAEMPDQVGAAFDGNLESLDRLENVTAALITNFHCWRAAWEQYALTCNRAKILKAEMSAAEPLVDA